MYEIAVMNPRRAKRKGKKRRKARKSNPGAKTVKRNSKGRFVKRASNPRKKKRRRHNPHRAKRRSKIRVKRTAHKVVISNPRRRKRRRHSNPRHHMRKRRYRRSNPISLGGMASGLVPALTDGAIGGAGALANSVLLGYLSPMLPATFTTGYAYDAVRIASAVALWMAGKQQALPGAQVDVELAFEFVHFLANAFDFDGLLSGGGGEEAQVRNVALEGINGALFQLVQFAGRGRGDGGGFGRGWFQSCCWFYAGSEGDGCGFCG